MFCKLSEVFEFELSKSYFVCLPRFLKNFKILPNFKISKKNFFFKKYFFIFFRFSVKISDKQTKYIKNFYRFAKFVKNAKKCGYWRKNWIKTHKPREKRNYDIRIFLKICSFFIRFFIKNALNSMKTTEILKNILIS